VTHQNTWNDEIARRIKELDSGKAKTALGQSTPHCSQASNIASKPA
jgi:hypothetical protein